MGCSALPAGRIVETEPIRALFRNEDTQEMVLGRSIATPIGMQEGGVIVVQNPVGLLRRTIIRTGRIRQVGGIAIEETRLVGIRGLQFQSRIGNSCIECYGSATLHQSLGIADQFQQLFLLSCHIGIVRLVPGGKKRLVLRQERSIGIGILPVCGTCAGQHLLCLVQCLIYRKQQRLIYRYIFFPGRNRRVNDGKLADAVVADTVGV